MLIRLFLSVLVCINLGFLICDYGLIFISLLLFFSTLAALASLGLESIWNWARTLFGTVLCWRLKTLEKQHYFIPEVYSIAYSATEGNFAHMDTLEVSNLHTHYSIQKEKEGQGTKGSCTDKKHSGGDDFHCMLWIPVPRAPEVHW